MQRGAQVARGMYRCQQVLARLVDVKRVATDTAPRARLEHDSEEEDDEDEEEDLASVDYKTINLQCRSS